ncbi:hypothetical protein Psal071_03576 (plasmid) [Piscirickettsia salmonis]|uniref:Uncharacterized protein n=3 Tax=Piscirickettsia salmonis TaxID=1238 RepID=A0A9Q6PTX4_PISSA|nr:hypothetical protein [Piscirickettsia salmonis]QGN96902.1 hypothetical protein Psal006a_03557 [Piscirickettsia salmonis]QGO07750.1 hypothetical protein Psal009_03709 [Piscirickettsia salmonis]QGO36210.1 hypothetical protein Psal028_03597 [Piscirickettsia salmonis]QGO39834.1 hypothetical protein Psal040_03611 [Piscirickettsia salmonis]QGO43397.1 hypothetical protein Psal041_03548 [Piscirickettsia salmonis]
MGLKKTTHRKKSGKTIGYLYTFDLIYPEKTLCVEFEVMHPNILKAEEAVEAEFDQWVGEQEEGATDYDCRYKTIRGYSARSTVSDILSVG